MHPKEQDDLIKKFQEAGGETVEAFLAWLQQEGLFICTDEIGLTTHDLFVPVSAPERAALPARFTKINYQKLVDARVSKVFSDMRMGDEPGRPKIEVDAAAPKGTWGD